MNHVQQTKNRGLIAEVAPPKNMEFQFELGQRFHLSTRNNFTKSAAAAIVKIKDLRLK